MVYYYSENPLFEIVKLIKNTKKKLLSTFWKVLYRCMYLRVNFKLIGLISKMLFIILVLILYILFINWQSMHVFLVAWTLYFYFVCKQMPLFFN